MTKQDTVLAVHPVLNGQITSPMTQGVQWRVVILGSSREILATLGVFSCPNYAGECFAEAACHAAKNGADITLRYEDGSFQITQTDASSYCDRMAEIMWEYIEAENEDLSDDPAEYGPVADGHPLDCLRNEILCGTGQL